MSVSVVRSIIEIDEEKCDGCGLCVPACEEGAIRIVDGKARLVADRYCDGLGACLGECPRGAITLVERPADEFDERAALEHAAAPAGCPAARALSLDVGRVAEPGVLRNWPVQLALVPPSAPWLGGADLLISADCVPFACAGFHAGLLDGRAVITACPKLDDLEPYLSKLTGILSERNIASITVARMVVPCCSALTALVEQAVQASGSNTPASELLISIDGELLPQQ